MTFPSLATKSYYNVFDSSVHDMTSPNFFPICTTLGMGVSLKKYKGIKTSSLRALTLFKDLFHYCVTHKKSHFCKIFNFACLRRRGFWHFEEITTFIKVCVWTFYVIILHKMLPLKNVPQIFAELCWIHMDSKIFTRQNLNLIKCEYYCNCDQFG